MISGRGFTASSDVEIADCGPDAEALFTPYARFSNAVELPVATPVSVVSQAHDLPPATLHRHGLVRLDEGTLVELDEYPLSARRRHSVRGKLPPGMAMVTFGVESLGKHEFIGPETAAVWPGFEGASACLRGATGELIELAAPNSCKG